MTGPSIKPSQSATGRAGQLAQALRARENSAVPTSKEILHGLIGPVLTPEAPVFSPVGALPVPYAEVIWEWMARDVAPALARQASQAVAAGASPSATSEVCGQISAALMAQHEAAKRDDEKARRLRVQIDDEEAVKFLPMAALAFKAQPTFERAGAFGRSLDAQKQDQAIGLTLKSLPGQGSPLFPFFMYVAMGGLSHPIKPVMVLINLSGIGTEEAIVKGGFAPVLDALASQAQTQFSLMSDDGPFADMDLACSAVARFHQIVRALSVINETDKHSRWSQMTARLISHVSDQLGPRIERIEADVRQSLRPARGGTDSLDTELLLQALNGMYLLATVREARDSLGVNSVLESAWSQTGQVLEILINRNLEAYKQNPADDIVARRLDAAINMARIRFNPEYAEILKKARDGASRRLAKGTPPAA